MPGRIAGILLGSGRPAKPLLGAATAFVGMFSLALDYAARIFDRPMSGSAGRSIFGPSRNLLTSMPMLLYRWDEMRSL